MSHTLKVLFISGSLRKNSYNTAALRAAKEGAPNNMQIEFADLSGIPLYDLRRAMVFLDMHCINKPEVMISTAHERFDAEGRLTDDTTREFIGKLVSALGDWTRRLQAGEQQ